MVLCGQQHSGAVVSHVASQQEGPCPCMGFLQALQLLPICFLIDWQTVEGVPPPLLL